LQNNRLVAKQPLTIRRRQRQEQKEQRPSDVAKFIFAMYLSLLNVRIATALWLKT